jgi:hypothetical protein
MVRWAYMQLILANKPHTPAIANRKYRFISYGWHRSLMVSHLHNKPVSPYISRRSTIRLASKALTGQLAHVVLYHASSKIKMIFRTVGDKHKYIGTRLCIGGLDLARPRELSVVSNKIHHASTDIDVPSDITAICLGDANGPPWTPSASAPNCHKHTNCR